MRPLNKFFGRRANEDWTQNAVILYSRALKATKYMGVLPYNWNVREQKLEYSESLVRSVVFITQYLSYLMYEGLVIFRWISYYFDENASLKSKASLQYVALGYMVPVALQSCCVFNRENLHNSVNRLLLYSRDDFQRLPDNGRKLRKVGALGRIIPFAAAAVLCLNMVTLFRRPTSPHLLTSLVADVTKRRNWELIPFALIHGYLWCNQWAIILFYCTLMTSYISGTLNALNRTRSNRNLSEERFYRATRKLGVLQRNHNSLFRWLWWAIEVLSLTNIVFGFCGSVRNEGAQAARQFFVSTLVLGALLTLWKGFGRVYATSREVHQEWRMKDGLPSLLFRKRIKSMRPIRVDVGGYFYVDSGVFDFAQYHQR